MVATHLVELTCELLEAHADTVELAGDLSDDRDWTAHLEYLRALQRTGWAMLAADSPVWLPLPELPPERAGDWYAAETGSGDGQR